MGHFNANRVNENGSLVVIIDERGALCRDFVPGSVKRGGYMIENFGDIVVCQKIFKQENKAEVVRVGEREVALPNHASMKKMIGISERVTPIRNFESRSHSRNKPRYGRQGEVDHFHYARQAEELAAVAN